MKKILLVFILVLFMINVVSAEHTLDFLNDLTEQLTETCYGEDLEIKEGFLKNSITGEGITFLKKSEWTYPTLNEMVKALDKGVYMSYTMIPCKNAASMGTGAQGCGALKCGDNRLDISGDDYYINDIKFETAKTRVTYTVYRSLINIGTINLTLFQFSLALISGSLISIILILKLIFVIKNDFSITFWKIKISKVNQPPTPSPQPHSTPTKSPTQQTYK